MSSLPPEPHFNHRATYCDLYCIARCCALIGTRWIVLQPNRGCRLDLLISRSRVDYDELARLEREDEATRRASEHEDVWHSVLAPRIINERAATDWPAKEPRAWPKKGANAGAAGLQTEGETADSPNASATFKERGLLDNMKRYRNRKSRRDYEATEKRLVQEGIVLPGGMLAKAMLSPAESPAPL